ncbi:uncharacterized protein LOC117211023 [Bombus bifarius]|uniref:Uncharacterized protein LOC117211023 n=1 Tax=Bombus bifarius TaxID=103933 RepID=A0A6P8N6R2_9HYME|nr:uncharacterized protein LOC117211023 [Bombus bifarius]
MQCVCESRVDIVVISEPYRQLSYWFNDEGGDASIWVTLFNGKHAASETLIRNVGIVGVRVGDAFCVSGYCSPNKGRDQFNDYLKELEGVIKEGRKRAPAIMVAGDFNAKSSVCGGGGFKTERRGTCLLDVITRNELIPIRTTGSYSFLRNGGTSFPDIISVNRRMRGRGSRVLDWYSASDHLYIEHRFKDNIKRVEGGAFRYLTKEMDVEGFINKFDEVYNGNGFKFDEAACGERLQKSLVHTCAVDLKRKYPVDAKRSANYWWNDELAKLRSETLRARRRAQHAVAARKDGAEVLVAEFKDARRRLKRAIRRSKEESWKGFCATLD